MSNTSREELADRLERVRNRLTGADIAEICAALRSQGSGNGGAEAVAAYIDDLERHGTIEHEVAYEIKRRLPPSEPSQRSEAETWRHLKRGSVVTVMGRGKAQCATNCIGEMTDVTIYQHDGKWWVRRTDEFEDGRFERLTAAPAPKCEAENVEAAAQALANDVWHPPQPLSSLSPSEVNKFRRQARIVLAALGEPQDAVMREALEAAQAAMADGGIEDTPFVRLALKKINRALSPTPTGPG